MALATLEAIRKKVRRLTRSPSDSQITDAEIDEYVNTFILYDFPQSLRLFSLRTTFTFYTQPFQGEYETSSDPNSALYNFKNIYTAIHPPVFLAGIQGYYSQKRAEFYANWPQVNAVQNTQLTGNNSPGPFTGTLPSAPVLANNVVFSCLNNTGQSMVIRDYPISNVEGDLGLERTTPAHPSPFGTINYVTGQYTLNFPQNTAMRSPIFAETIPFRPGKPIAILFYDNKFTVRPVPDNTYVIQLEADIRPTALINSTDVPQIEQWWQWIAFGASKKRLEDIMDFETIELIMPEYKEQESLVNSSTIEMAVNNRTSTIYTQGKYYGYGWFPTNWPY